MNQFILCITILQIVSGAPAPYARLTMRPASELAPADGSVNKHNNDESRPPTAPMSTREPLRLQNQRVSGVLADGPLTTEKAHRLCAMLFDDLGTPDNNALWAQSMLQRLGAIASNDDTPEEIVEAIRYGVLDYYSQQRAMHPSTEFVSPMCMWAMGNALRSVGDSQEVKTDADALRNGAIGWLRAMGYQSQADRLTEELSESRESESDVTVELLRAYARLLAATPEPSRMELSRMQSIMRSLVEKERVTTRQQWDLWTRAMIKFGKRADSSTRSFIRERLKSEADSHRHKYFQSVAKKLEIRDQSDQ